MTAPRWSASSRTTKSFERRWRDDVLPSLAAHGANYHLGTGPRQIQSTVDQLRADLKANPLPTPDGPPVDHNALDAPCWMR
ncbi:hypothetical protein [Saccharopolyspora spinosa]|uniref:hypothetical protein n=1 Tax=Saccharopolyspora spinosa TaxID=60894 RepID=UPI00023789D4|nr:hypothetical protein [Saccharopolyspora spinosa]